MSKQKILLSLPRVVFVSCGLAVLGRLTTDRHRRFVEGSLHGAAQEPGEEEAAETRARDPSRDTRDRRRRGERRYAEEPRSRAREDDKVAGSDVQQVGDAAE